jgi:hypothetical protein
MFSLFYLAVLLIVIYRLLVTEPKHEIKEPRLDVQDHEKALLVLCQNDRVKSDIFRFYRHQGNTSCLDKMAVDFKYGSTRADRVLTHFCRLADVDREKAAENLAVLKLRDLSKPNVSPEEVLKIYAAVKIAGDGDCVVFNDFFKMKSRQFEEAFAKLLDKLEASGKKVLYLSCEMPAPKASLAEKINLKNFAAFPLRFDKVTLR